MPFELIVKVENRPGMLTAAAGVLGKENVNIRGFSAIPPSEWIRFLPDDADAGERALKEAGYEVKRAEVVTHRISNTPGELALVAERLSKAGVNIEAAYLAASAEGEKLELVFEVSDVKAAKKALK